MTKLEELKQAMSKAVAEFQESGDMSKILEVTREMNKAKAELAKAEAEKARVEAEKLAGAREKLATTIHQQIRALGLDKAIIDLKGWGFTYKCDNANPSEPGVAYKSVSLLTAAVKAAGFGGIGGAGKTKSEYGVSLADVFEKYATEEDRGKLAAAETNSKQWQVKVAVKKRAIADKLLVPAK